MSRRPIRLELSDEQRQALEAVRDRSPKAYLRERAAALLKIAAGESGLQVAEHGLLKRRKADTVYEWVQRYRAGELEGLTMTAGRGRKPAFSPSISPE